MKRLYLLIAILLLSLSGCMNKEQDVEVSINNYPDFISANKSFLISGELKVKDLNSSIRDLELVLSIYNENDSILLKKEKMVPNKTDTFEFSNLIIENSTSQFLLELIVLESGNVIAKDSVTLRPNNWHTNIVTTYFNIDNPDTDKIETTAWGETKDEINPYYFALPYRPYYNKQVYLNYTDVKNMWIEINYNGKTAYAQWEDVGPWNVYDPFYVFGTDENRPYAELGIDMGWHPDGVRDTNKAGLDVSKSVMDYLAKNSIYYGKINVNWRFVERSQVKKGPWLEKITISQSNIFNFNTKTLRTIK